MKTWQEVESLHPWTELLLGNGFSRAMDGRFGYGRLLEEAAFSPSDRRLFGALGTDNFEHVMSVLRRVEAVARDRGFNTDVLEYLYVAYRDALIKAIGNNHAPFRDLAWARLLRRGALINAHQRVFTTNYDLVTYWASMATQDGGGPPPLDDGFATFDGAYAVWDPARARQRRPGALYYLHGALHLTHDPVDRATYKIKGQSSHLLDTIKARWLESRDLPLVVSEGDAESKEATIRDNPYLSACLDRFEKGQAPLVILGHDLGPPDRHIVQAVRERTSPVAVSLYDPSGDISRLAPLVAAFDARLQRTDIHYFPSWEHPLLSQ